MVSRRGRARYRFPHVHDHVPADFVRLSRPVPSVRRFRQHTEHVVEEQFGGERKSA